MFDTDYLLCNLTNFKYGSRYLLNSIRETITLSFPLVVVSC